MRVLLQLACATAVVGMSVCQKKAASVSTIYIPGDYAARCEIDGTFRKQQCDDKGECFCVDTETGVRIRLPLSECSDLCSTARGIAYSSNSVNRVIPTCSEDGKTWEALQCHHDACFCADPATGDKIGDNATECASPCQLHRMRAVKNLMPGTHVPKCYSNGTYVERQCMPSGACWCVDSETGARTECPVEKYTTCAEAQEIAKDMHLLGGYVPKCTEDGKQYLPRQCQGGVHDKCWCVEVLTGKNSGMTGEACDIEAKPTCAEAKKAAEEKGFLGAFIPQCSDDGKQYLPRQCQGGVHNKCWCVDVLTGEHNGMTGDACDVEAKPTCAEAKKAAEEKGLFGAYVPKCSDDGKEYLPRQCQGGVHNKCWCVDVLTGEHNGMTGDACDVEAKPTCAEAKKTAEEKGFFGAFVPKCSDDGKQYLPRQCQGGVHNKCWCVDVLTGEHNGMTGDACDVEAKPTCAEAKKAAEEKGLFGAYVPKCSDDGKEYLPRQCQGGVHNKCWCVDVLTGEHNGMTGDACDVKETPACADAKKAAEEKGFFGAFVPKCSEDGKQYLPRQCQGGVHNKCWCVDVLTGEHNGMTGDACDIEAKPTCAEAKKTAEEKGFLGAFIPQCSDDGKQYLPRQCQGGVHNKCWCVDVLTGEHNGMTGDACDVEAKPTCAEAKKAAEEKGLFGAYVPKCSEDGKQYLPRQCQGGVHNKCWCVDVLTGEHNGMTGDACDVKETPACADAKKAAEEKGFFGAFVPKCSEDGKQYLPRQCQGGVHSKCWCVDVLTGEHNGMTGDACDVEATTTCAEAKKAAEEKGFFGAYVPKCSEDGKQYLPRQCQGGVHSKCWCVEVLTGKPNGMTGDACDVVTEATPTCADAKKAAEVKGFFGAFVPKCSEDGKQYLPRQCQGGVHNKCWCVDVLTGEDNGMTGDACDVVAVKETAATCAEAARKVSGTTRVGVYIPQCSEDGNYLPRQCHPSTGMCWCVDTATGLKTGAALEQCSDSEPATACLKARKQALDRPRRGGFTPTCDADGNYLPRQCQGGVHNNCWCVDVLTGERNAMTGDACDVAPTAEEGSCAERRSRLLEGRNLIGAFIPQCDTDGRYLHRQCHGSTGRCWCVDADSGEPSGLRGRRCTAGLCFAAQLLAGRNTSAVPYTPLCEADGSYALRQCEGQQCFCVDRHGRPTGTPLSACSETPCQASRRRALIIVSRYTSPPTCTVSGAYKTVQCNAAQAGEPHCQCVTPENGTPIERGCSVEEGKVVAVTDKGVVVQVGDANVTVSMAQEEQEAQEVYVGASMQVGVGALAPVVGTSTTVGGTENASGSSSNSMFLILTISSAVAGFAAIALGAILGGYLVTRKPAPVLNEAWEHMTDEDLVTLG